MTIEATKRFAHLPGYPLAAITVAKRELIARGVDVIDLGAGDADLMPPPKAIAALKESVMVPENNRYNFGSGFPEFREAAATWMEKRFGTRFDPATEVLPLIGSKEGIAHLALAYVDPGDVTIIPDPGYACYLGGTILAGGIPHIVPLEAAHDFLVPVERIPADIAKRAKILFLNYPNNPTAAEAPREYLGQVVAWCREHSVVLAFDNAYSEIAFDGYKPPSIFEIEGAREVAIEFHSFSKTYNMTGWRAGWAVGNRQIIAALARVKTFVDTGMFRAVSRAGMAAFESWSEWVPQNVAAFQARRDAAVDAFRSSGFDVRSPSSTMYLWLPIPTKEPGAALVDRTLSQQGVVMMPGSALGEHGEGFVRVALTTSPERLAEAAKRVAKCL